MNTTVLNSDPKDFTMPLYGFKRYRKDDKMACVRVKYNGNRMEYTVSYYDEDYNRRTHTRFACCQSPTHARTAKGVMSKIKQFFGSLDGVTVTHEI